jgi:hypothetical protein
VTVIHAANDPVADPRSAKIIYESIASTNKRLHMVNSDRHAILHEDIENTQDLIIGRLLEFSRPSSSQAQQDFGPSNSSKWKFLRWLTPRTGLRRVLHAKESLD